jgi:hypothetical protein
VRANQEWESRSGSFIGIRRTERSRYWKKIGKLLDTEVGNEKVKAAAVVVLLQVDKKLRRHL